MSSGGGVVRTAGEGMLAGTVRALALDACAEAGLRVELAAPRLDALRAGTWREVFLTSTSRLVLPVDVVHVPAQDGRAAETFRLAGRDGPVAARLLELVEEGILQDSGNCNVGEADE